MAIGGWWSDSRLFRVLVPLVTQRSDFLELNSCSFPRYNDMTHEPTLARRVRWRIRTALALWVFVAFFAVGDFVFGYVFQSGDDWLALACLGLVGAQGGLHAIWYDFASVRPVTRLGLGAGVGLGWYGMWMTGYAFQWTRHGSPYPWSGVATGLLCLPLVLLAVRSPLWLARYFFRWRVLHRRDPARRSPFQSIGIRDILLATGAVAVALSAARTGVMVSYPDSEASLLILGLYALLAAALSLFTTLPVVVATLRARRLWLALLIVLFFVLLSTVGFVAGIRGIAGEWPPREVYPLLALMAACFFVCLTGPLLIMRWLGYRLYWGRRHVTRRGNGSGSRKAPGVATPGLGGM